MSAPLPPTLTPWLRLGKRQFRRLLVTPLLDRFYPVPLLAGGMGLALGWGTGHGAAGFLLALLGTLAVWLPVARRFRKMDTSELRVSSWLDQRLGLEDRLSTVVDLTRKQPDHPFLPTIQQQLQDHLPTEPPVGFFDTPPSWRWRGSLLVALLLPALVWALPPNPLLAQKKKDEALSAQSQKQLAAAARAAAQKLNNRQLDKNPRLRQERLREQRRLLELARRLQEGKMSRSQALRELEKARSGLKNRQDWLKNIENDPQAAARRKLARQLEEAGKTASDQRKQMEEFLQDAARRQKNFSGAVPPLPKNQHQPFSREQSKTFQDELGLDKPPKNQRDLQEELRQKMQEDQQGRDWAKTLEDAEQSLDKWRPDGQAGNNQAQNQGAGGQKGEQTAGGNQGQQGGGKNQQGGQGQQGGQSGGQGQQGNQGQQGGGKNQQGGQQGQEGQQGGGQGQGQGGQQGGGGQGQGSQGGGVRRAGGAAGGGPPQAGDAGRGTTNQAQKGQQTRRRNGFDGRQFDGFKPEWREAYVRLYKSVKVARRGTATRVKGRKGEGPDKGYLPTEAPIRDEEWSVAPSDAVVPPGRNVEEALDHAPIPPGEEDTVRDYFDAISGE